MTECMPCLDWIFKGDCQPNEGGAACNQLIALAANLSDVDRMEELAEQLNQYGKYGIPPLSSDNSLASEHEDFRLEDDWTSIVADASRFSERKRQQQTAIWELIQTEAAYIVDVEVITKLFLACLMNLRKSRILVDIDVNKLFANMQDILNANVDFWRRTILPMLEIARSSKEPLDPSLMKDGFCSLEIARSSKEPLDPSLMKDGFCSLENVLRPYTEYCLEQTGCQQYCRERDQENEMFKAYLAVGTSFHRAFVAKHHQQWLKTPEKIIGISWCETQKDCNRLRLMDLLVKPMQRITKYPLLLKVILKYSDEDYEKEDLVEMVARTEQFVTAINAALRHKQEQIRLDELSNKISAYEVLDSKDDELQKLIKKYSELDLACPMVGLPSNAAIMASPSGRFAAVAASDQIRVLLHEGDLKIRDHISSKAFTRVGRHNKPDGCALLLVHGRVFDLQEHLWRQGQEQYWNQYRDRHVTAKATASKFLDSPALLRRDRQQILSEFKTATSAFILQAVDAKSCK
ncbi:unnamed protein product, partial [Notodromas monacha]